MRVFFINNDGGGFASHVEVSENTTYNKFFDAHMNGADSGKYKIRVTRSGSRFTPEGDQLVQDGDRVSITPAKITGYRLASYRLAA
jgi:hypothetical protein